MSTLGTMAARISTELKRGDISASSTVVIDAINTAIKHYETSRFWFNEATDNTIYTSTDQQFISSVPSDIIKIDTLKVTISSRDYPLEKVDYRYIDTIDSGQWSGFPEVYSWYKKQIRVYPRPNGNYQLTFSYMKDLGEVSAHSQTNEWTDDCERMIRCRAKGEIFENVIRNLEMAGRMYKLADEAYRSINRETNARLHSGRVTPTHF